MKQNFTRYFLFLFLFCVATIPLFGQNVLKGTIRDEVDGTPLPYAQIHVHCNSSVVMSDDKGNFRLELKEDTCELTFRYTLYTDLQRNIIFSSKKEMVLNIKLSPSAKILGTANVTSTKYETNPEKSTTSILVLSPKTAEDRNFTTVDQLINTAGGIAVVNNEPQIRGGSGFSSGMGSRVLILLDNMPMLRPDAGRPMWNFIPMEDVEQIEVLKGAASVVFGSSALTGAINVHTAYPRLKPKTKVVVFAGMYSNPNPTGRERYYKSWQKYNPIKYGVNFLHSRIIKKNFDLVVGGEFFRDQGYIGNESNLKHTQNTDSSTLGQQEIRARLNFAARYRFAKVKGLSVSLNGNFMYSKNGQSFFWYDAYENRYRSYDGSLSKFTDKTMYVDPTITYVGKGGFVFEFRNRIMASDNGEETGAQNARSFSLFDELQVNKTFNRIGMKLVAGIMNNYVTSYGRAFSGDNYSENSVKMYSNNMALYVQLEQRFLKKRNLIVQLGGRWEFYSLEGETENKPIFRTGINYQLDKWKTAFRASFGQGYRYPSIGEKFISISVGRYGFYPNSNLVSEKSWNAEIGIMQPFSVFDFQGIADVALFTQHYDNYIEFAMGQWGTQGNVMDRFGFKYMNIGPARISGIDFSMMGEGKIAKNVTYTLSISYTYSNPITLDPNYVYYVDSVTKAEVSFNNSSYDTTRRVLKYRIEHMAKLDLGFTFYKKFSIGVSASFYSAMKNVDKFFFTYDIDNPELTPGRIAILKALGDLPFRGYYEYFHSKENKGGFVFDARMSYAFKNISLSFIVKNIFNRSYSLRPMYVEPPRTFTLQLVCNI